MYFFITFATIMRNLSVIIMLCLAMIATAQKKEKQPPRIPCMEYGTEKDMPLFYEQLKSQLTFPWSWQKMQSTMSFEQWRNETRALVEATMQLAPPSPSDYSYEIIATEQRDGYEAQKIRFHINEWENVLAYMLVPTIQNNHKGKNGKGTSRKSDKFPALLLFHDHGAHFSIGKEKMIRPFGVDSLVSADADDWSVKCYDGRYVGDELAKAGYVVLCTDALFWGDRGRKEGVRYDSQQALSANLLQMGTSWGAWITWDDIRSAEFLASLPMVDADRIGCLGFSMGSYRAWMTSALTDVVKACAAICWMNDTEHLMSLTNNQNKGGSAYSMLIPGIRNLMDYADVASLACPKPTLFFNGAKDKLFPVEGVQNAYNTMREVWHSQGADDNLETKIWDEKHFFNKDMQQSVLNFFDKNLSERTPDVKSMQDSLVKSFLKVKIPNHKIKIKPLADKNDNALPMLQSSIDQLSANGGGKLMVQKGAYFLRGSLHMKSNVELHLNQGALLLFSGVADDFLPVVQTRWEGTNLMGRSAMIYANGATNFAITGEGIIDAQGGKEMARWGMTADTDVFSENTHGTHGETIEMPDVRRLRALGDTEGSQRIFGEGTHLRPCAIEFYGCSKVLIEGITLKNSPFWCIHPVYCDNVTVRGITIDSHFPNNDGCDPESSRNILIENCVFRTGDDAVAIKAGRDADGRRIGIPSENIVIRHCRFYSECNGLCIGSEMSGGVKNVLMHDVEIGDVKNALLFKSNLDRGGYIRNVFVDNIRIASAQGAVLRFETNYFGYRGGNYPAQYADFRISNIKAGKAEGYGIYFDGPGIPTASEDGGVKVSPTSKNTGYAIRNIRVSDFHVDKASHSHYLFNTKHCQFINSTVNGKAIPFSPQESDIRQSCDVW